MENSSNSSLFIQGFICLTPLELGRMGPKLAPFLSGHISVLMAAGQHGPQLGLCVLAMESWLPAGGFPGAY